MHTIINSILSQASTRSSEVKTSESFRQPNYECQDQGNAMKLEVFVPGVSADGVDIEAQGPDLLITARKSHFIRVNWSSLHLEGAQRDYQLRLRLGLIFDYSAMRAEIHNGILSVTVPKRNVVGCNLPLQRVA
ncbi:MAG: Hsp20/alpha crystallin family protein [Opitutaceae bacterium]